jgi:2-amino-4-hydroxy-6-hydroxymethyldihydropteridine diphosphokinase
VPRAYLGLGSNLGDRSAHLQRALDGLARAPGIALVAISHVYATDPVGGPEQDEYLNAVVSIDTFLTARELLGVAKDLEQAAGRVRGERWGPRTLDVDVLIVGDEQVHTPDLEVPHPRLRERGFVQAPLADVAPDLVVRAPRQGWPGLRRVGVSLRLPPETGTPAPSPRPGPERKGPREGC